MKRIRLLLSVLVFLLICSFSVLRAIDIPLESLTPVRIGFIDLQKVFDTYPEKAFAEGDLLKEIERRKRDLSHRQQDINILRQQIAADQAVLTQSKSGQSVRVPANAVTEPEPPKPVVATPAASSTTVKSSSAAAAAEPYPTDDPLAGLPGHSPAAAPAPAGSSMPGMQPGSDSATKWPLLEQLSTSSSPVTLNGDGATQLQDRINVHQKILDKDIVDFKSFRTNAVGDMKQLQTQKTYGVMAKIYATLQTLARDEGITVVLDKAYVLYGEDAVDLSDKLVSRLQQDSLQ